MQASAPRSDDVFFMHCRERGILILWRQHARGFSSSLMGSTLSSFGIACIATSVPSVGCSREARSITAAAQDNQR